MKPKNLRKKFVDRLREALVQEIQEQNQYSLQMRGSPHKNVFQFKNSFRPGMPTIQHPDYWFTSHLTCIDEFKDSESLEREFAGSGEEKFYHHGRKFPGEGSSRVHSAWCGDSLSHEHTLRMIAKRVSRVPLLLHHSLGIGNRGQGMMAPKDSFQGKFQSSQGFDQYEPT